MSISDENLIPIGSGIVSAKIINLLPVSPCNSLKKMNEIKKATISLFS